MKFKQIIKNTAEILGLSDVVELINEDATIEELNNNSNYRLLLRCSALVVANLATHYSELTATQRFNVSVGGRIDFSSFDNPPISIKSARQNGERVRFTTFIDHIIVPRTGQVDVVYTYLPKVTTGDEINPFPIPHATIEYGILAEYAFIQGMMCEAQVWNAKFGEMLFSVKQKNGKSIKMPESF